MKKLGIIVLAVVLCLGLTAGMAAAQQKVLKVGVLGPYTGPAAKTGEELRNAALIAFEKIGYKIGDYKIELVFIDDQSDGAKATNAYSEAIERQGVQAGYCNWNSGVTMAVMDVLAQFKVPHFFTMGSSQSIIDKWKSDPKYQYMMTKGWAVPGKLVQGYVDLLNAAEKKGTFKPASKTAALYGEDTDWGRDFVAGMEKALVAAGWKIASKDFFALTQTDFYPTLSKYKAANVALVAGTSSSIPSITGLCKQAAELQLKSVLIADGLSWTGDWYKMVGKASDGVLDMMPVFATKEDKEFEAAYKKKFNSAPSPSAAGMGYNMANAFIHVCKRAYEKYKKLDKETIYNVGKDELLTGKLVFTRKDGLLLFNRLRYEPATNPDPVVSPEDWFFPVVQYKEGKPLVVFPENVKQADFVVKK